MILQMRSRHGQVDVLPVRWTCAAFARIKQALWHSSGRSTHTICLDSFADTRNDTAKDQSMAASYTLRPA